MKSVELAVVGAYCIAMLVIGFYFRGKAAKSSSSFWSAESSVGVAVNAFALLATVMSGGGMMGNIGMAASLGIAFILAANLGSGAGLGMAALVVAKPLRRSGAKTISEFVKMRYQNKGVSYLVPIVIAVAYTIYLVAQMKASGTVGQYLLGTSFNVGLIATWAIFTLYVMLGGMLAVTWTDFLQGMMMILVVIVSSAAALSHFGGFTNLMALATTNFANIGKMYLPLSSYMGFFFLWVVIGLCSPHILMRVGTAKNPFGAAIAMHGGMILITVFSVLTSIVLGSASRAAIGPGAVANNDACFLLLLDQIFNPFWKGIAASAIFAAIMSTAAGLLIAAAAAVANDIIVNIHRPDMDEKTQSKLGSLTVLGISCVVLAFSFNPPAYLSILYSMAMGFLASSLVVPLMAGLWWRRANDIGALAAIISGGLSYAILLFSHKMPQFSEIFIAIPISLIFLIIFSLATKEPSQETLARVESWHDTSADLT